jgi:hypothetical protein
MGPRPFGRTKTNPVKKSGATSLYHPVMVFLHAHHF